MRDMLTWLGITFCITQSATFSSLNLAVFSLSRLRLETAVELGDASFHTTPNSLPRRGAAVKRDL
jgi:CBS domain containing-hemolysin-like protein